jgi:hypothetical protein
MVKIIRALIPTAIVSTLIVLIFGMYLFFIGIPRTQARNLYNEGVLSIQAGEIRPAIQYFRSALSYWPEDYIKTALLELEQLSF